MKEDMNCLETRGNRPLLIQPPVDHLRLAASSHFDILVGHLDGSRVGQLAASNSTHLLSTDCRRRQEGAAQTGEHVEQNIGYQPTFAML